MQPKIGSVFRCASRARARMIILGELVAVVGMLHGGSEHKPPRRDQPERNAESNQGRHHGFYVFSGRACANYTIAASLHSFGFPSRSWPPWPDAADRPPLSSDDLDAF